MPHLRAGGPAVFPSIGAVHVRRALLLFAIVLGLAAIAASVSRSPEESPERVEQPSVPPDTAPSAAPGNAPKSALELTFDADDDQRRRLAVGQAGTVFVEVEEPGLVEIPGLGLSAPAEELTPARFDVLVPEAGRFEITFTPSADDLPGPAGTLVVREDE
jgi:hypothetical protein